MSSECILVEQMKKKRWLDNSFIMELKQRRIKFIMNKTNTENKFRRRNQFRFSGKRTHEFMNLSHAVLW